MILRTLPNSRSSRFVVGKPIGRRSRKARLPQGAVTSGDRDPFSN